MLVKKVEDGYFLLDGNRRLTRAAWENMDTDASIEAYVCTVTGEPIYKDH